MIYLKNQDRRYSSVHDQEILYFIWRWKVVGVPVIAGQFSDRCSHKGIYNRVRALIREGQLKYIYMNDFNGFALTLTKKGFTRIKDDIGNLENEGYKSEATAHDFIVSAFHYGLFRIHSSFFVDALTESELRNTSPQNYPPPIPKTKVHRPDGYLLAGVTPTSSVIAIEVEWSRKEASRYEQLAEFYSKYTNVFGVWVAKTETIATIILNALNANAVLRGKRHLVFIWKDLLENDWNAKSINGGNTGKTLSDLVPSNYGKTAGKPLENLTLFFLTRAGKTPSTSIGYKKPEKSQIVTVPGAQKTPPSINITPDIPKPTPTSPVSQSTQTQKEEPPHE